MAVPIGVSNAVSFNLNYDPADSLKYIKQSNFNSILFHLNDKIMHNPSVIESIVPEIQVDPSTIYYFHSENYLNTETCNSDNQQAIFSSLTPLKKPAIIFRFDEDEELEIIMECHENITNHYDITTYLENDFLSPTLSEFEKNIRKFQAVFSLLNLDSLKMKPLINIPKFFDPELKIDTDAAVQWTCQIFNFFANKKIPVLLYISDVKEDQKERSLPCPLGEGDMPYHKLFGFLVKTRTPIEGIILHYTDKINPLKSREYLEKNFLNELAQP